MIFSVANLYLFIWLLNVDNVFAILESWFLLASVSIYECLPFFLAQSVYLSSCSTLPKASISPYYVLFLSAMPYQVPFSPQAFTFTILCILIKLSDSPISLTSNYENEASIVMRAILSHCLHHFPFAYDRLGLDIISINDDFFIQKGF